MNTKEDFIKAVEIVQTCEKTWGRGTVPKVVMFAFIEFFESTNPTFDIEQFRMACDLARCKCADCNINK